MHALSLILDPHLNPAPSFSLFQIYPSGRKFHPHCGYIPQKRPSLDSDHSPALPTEQAGLLGSLRKGSWGRQPNASLPTLSWEGAAHRFCLVPPVPAVAQSCLHLGGRVCLFWVQHKAAHFPADRATFSNSRFIFSKSDVWRLHLPFSCSYFSVGSECGRGSKGIVHWLLLTPIYLRPKDLAHFKWLLLFGCFCK